MAAPGDTGSASAASRIVVVTPLSLVKVNDLKFGKVANTASGGTVVVNPQNSACTVTGPLLHIGTCQAAEFAGMGARNMTVRLRITNVVNLTGPGAPMVLDLLDFDTSPDLQLIGSPTGNGNGSGNKRYRILPSSGIFNFRVGGTLHVNANQAAGAYTGSFLVTAQYQ